MGGWVRAWGNWLNKDLLNLHYVRIIFGLSMVKYLQYATQCVGVAASLLSPGVALQWLADCLL